MRQRNTHRLRVYEQVESTTETDLLGNALDDWDERFAIEVYAYPPSTVSAGGSSRTRAGLVTDADMVALAHDPVADTTDVGEDHAILERLTDDWSAPFVVEHVRALSNRGAAPEQWEIHLALESGGDTEGFQ